jgi:putative transposase
VNHLVSENINTLIVGNNRGWKQDTRLGKVNNQNFCLIPFYRFIQMLQYKCDLAGINMEITSEEYTSVCSFLDQEKIGKHTTYLGNRVKRGLFVSSTGIQINADVNGSYNILRKCKPNAFANGVSGVVAHPRVIRDVESSF